MNGVGVRVERRGDVLWVTLERPERRNAFDGEMIRGIEAVVGDLPQGTRAVVLAGEGTAFCAGANLEWMAGPDACETAVRPECETISRFYATLDALAVPLLARVHGPAAGGGVGLAAVADLAVASETATFRLSEVRVGLLPAMIAPYVARRIGWGRTREWALTAERIDARTAMAWGLVSEVVANERLDPAVEAKLDLLRSSPPEALAAAKAFFRRVDGRGPAEAAAEALRAISERLSSAEARERIREFTRKGPARA
ncbi:MAG: enoyl-CoA hydratase/isomerase family protein [Deltaproteobacteria bacterium]|nr:enoyl-CoA hydratase/isomerase family protein [Deltaproteobacteria bacterium]